MNPNVKQLSKPDSCECFEICGWSSLLRDLEVRKQSCGYAYDDVQINWCDHIHGIVNYIFIWFMVLTVIWRCVQLNEYPLGKYGAVARGCLWVSFTGWWCSVADTIIVSDLLCKFCTPKWNISVVVSRMCVMINFISFLVHDRWIKRRPSSGLMRYCRSNCVQVCLAKVLWVVGERRGVEACLRNCLGSM